MSVNEITIFIKLIIFINIIKKSDELENSTIGKCMTINSDTRTFDSLSSFQGNKVPFNPEMKGFQGNYVTFSFKLEKIPRNAFITFTSNQIVRLSLSNKNINVIETEAFTSLFCLKMLDLRHNKIIFLDKSVFKDLSSLEELYLSYNHIEKLYDLGFHQLISLLKLNLSNNRINEVQSFAFANLTKLQELDISYNNLRRISAETFVPLGNLKLLHLAYNHFYDLEPEKWMSLNKLKILDLSGNYLKKFDTSYEFSFYGLQSLNLSGNSLTQLNIYALRKHLPQLKLLDINENEWLCINLIEIDHQLKDSNINWFGRSNYRTQVNNVTCKESEFDYVPISNREHETTEKIRTLPVSSTTESVIYKNVKDVFTQSREILYTDHKILNTVENIKVLIIYLFILVIIILLLNVLFKIDFCNLIYRRFLTFSDISSTFREDNINRSYNENYALIRN